MADDYTDPWLASRAAALRAGRTEPGQPGKNGGESAGLVGRSVSSSPPSLPAAVRRVAPDRETLAKVLAELDLGFAHMAPAPALLYADALLASGVLGVPADQRTADRETIAQAIVAVELGFAHMDPGPALIYADAVLAVLVPADQVRAETLRRAANSADLAGTEGGRPFSDALHRQADEIIRKGAGA